MLYFCTHIKKWYIIFGALVLFPPNKAINHFLWINNLFVYNFPLLQNTISGQFINFCTRKEVVLPKGEKRNQIDLCTQINIDVFFVLLQFFKQPQKKNFLMELRFPSGAFLMLVMYTFFISLTVIFYIAAEKITETWIYCARCNVGNSTCGGMCSSSFFLSWLSHDCGWCIIIYLFV